MKIFLFSDKLVLTQSLNFLKEGKLDILLFIRKFPVYFDLLLRQKLRHPSLLTLIPGILTVPFNYAVSITIN